MRGRQLLVLPLLSPVLAVLVVAALNPGPRVSFRLLTWDTPRAPLALWLASAALGGAALSGGAAGLALRSGPAGRGMRRTTYTPSQDWQEGLGEPPGREPWRTGVDGPGSAGRRRRSPVSAEAPWGDANTDAWPSPDGGIAPARAPGEPAPTLVVPFRVLRRPGASNPGVAEAAPRAWTARRPEAAAAREPVPVGIGDDWGEAASAEEEW
jgi:hypothetical protein